MTRAAAFLPFLLVCVVSAPPALAQGLPAYSPINPVAASRSALGFEPYRSPRPSLWSTGLGLDYASIIERAQLSGGAFDLDAEVLRLRFRTARDLGRSAFVEIDATAGGSYDGFLDGFLNWYHRLLGITLEEREARPENQFLYRIRLPDGRILRREKSDLFLGDTRVAFGIRHTPYLQTVASLTLPTSTAPAGYGLGVPAAGIITTAHATLARPLIFEGSLGLGYTPAHGDLTDYQRTTFVSASSGARWRFWGRQWLYANLFYHSPYYHDTRIPSLDRRELSLDFGWMLRTRRGPEWRIGLTEDLEPGGPAVDLVVRVSAVSGKR